MTLSFSWGRWVYPSYRKEEAFFPHKHKTSGTQVYSYYLLSLCGCKNYRTWCLLVLERAPPLFSLLGTIFSRICSSPRQISRIHLTQRLYRPAIGLFLKKMTWICAVATQPLIKKKVDVTTCLQLYKRFLSNEEYLFYKYRNIKYSC